MDLSTVQDPVRIIEGWVERSRREGTPHPDAMTLATVDESGAPRARIVLLKGIFGRSFRFFSNYESDKAQELAREPRAALTLFFPGLGFQARVRGGVERLSAELSDEYFASRPRLSQLGAWASAQSRPLASRAELERCLTEAEQRFAGRPVVRPPHWGGYGLSAHEIELWIAHDGRLHERALFRFTQSWSAPMLLFP